VPRAVTVEKERRLSFDVAEIGAYRPTFVVRPSHMLSLITAHCIRPRRGKFLYVN